MAEPRHLTVDLLQAMLEGKLSQEEIVETLLEIARSHGFEVDLPETAEGETPPGEPESD
jgi:hypothetical protein